MQVINLPNEIIPALIIVLSSILVNTILGIFISLKNKKFKADKLPKFFISGIFPYIGGLIILAVSAKYIGLFYTPIYYTVASTIMIKYLNDIRLKVKELFLSNVNDLSKF